MLNLGSTDFYIASKNLPKSEFESFTSQLFDQWEIEAAKMLELPDYSLLLTIEEGSIKGKGKIAAAATALYFGIGAYGDFISGIQQIKSQVIGLGEILADQAHQQIDPNAPKPKVRKQAGTLTKLETLFVKVQRQELSVDEAMQQANSILGEEQLLAPDFTKDLRKALKEIPLHPVQLPLPLEFTQDTPWIDELREEPLRDGKPQRLHRLPLHASPHVRVEVWRDSKKGKRRIRVTEI